MRKDHALVAIGASAGGIGPLSALLRSMPAHVPAAFCVVVHIPPTGSSSMARVLGRGCRVVTMEALDGARIRAGHAYVAPPDRHSPSTTDGCVSS
jgi:two-component system chemotaxis response regulator CheB